MLGGGGEGGKGRVDMEFNFLTSMSDQWPRQSFSLQYQYNIKQTSDEKNTKFSKLISQQLY